MSGIKRFFVKLLLLATMLLGLPLLGVWIAGHPVSDYLEFPPETRYVRHEPFSWLVFALYCLIISACLTPLVIKALKQGRKVAPENRPARPFPWWGWLGLIIVFPIAGALLYALFGINRVKRKAQRVTQDGPAASDAPGPAEPADRGAELSQPKRPPDPRAGHPVLPEGGFDLEAHLRDLEKHYLTVALERTEGNMTRAAELLGISFRSIRYKVKKLGIRRDDARDQTD